jgi:hypothetical protein
MLPQLSDVPKLLVRCCGRIASEAVPGASLRFPRSPFQSALYVQLEPQLLAPAAARPTRRSIETARAFSRLQL